MADIGTKNVREDELTPILGYDMVIIDNLQNTCTRGVIGYIRVRRTRCYYESNGLRLKYSMSLK